MSRKVKLPKLKDLPKLGTPKIFEEDELPLPSVSKLNGHGYPSSYVRRYNMEEISEILENNLLTGNLGYKDSKDKLLYVYKKRDMAVNLFEREPNVLYYHNYLARERIVVNQGGTFSSKSYSIMQVLFTIACSSRGEYIVVAGETIPKLKDDVMKIASSIVSENSAVKIFIKNFNIQDRRYEFTTGSVIEFKSYEKVEDAKGGKYDYLYISEATRFDYSTAEILIRNCQKKVFIDYNPTFRFWVHDILLERKKQYPSVLTLRSWHIHNNYISEEKHKEIESIEDPEMFRVYARGLTGRLKGAVFSWGIVKEFPSVLDLGVDLYVIDVIWGIDWGYTSDPTAITRVALMSDGSYIVDEIFSLPLGEIAGEPTSHLIGIMERHGYKSEMVYADHDKELITRMRRAGVMVYAAEKGNDAELNRVLYCKSRNIRVTARSHRLRDELTKYRFIEVDGELTNRIVKGNDHLIDSATMAIYTHRHRLRDKEFLFTS